MKIYTKSGDQGKTSLLGGKRVSKADVRIHAYGTVDELNSYVGLLKDIDSVPSRKDFLKHIQDSLFSIGAILAADPDGNKNIVPSMKLSNIQSLENEIDKMEESLPKMKNFVLPGGHTFVSYCHISRCVCRRAERWIIQLSEDQPVDEYVIQYMNRLSDYLFVLARKISQEVESEEIPWKPRG